jgi:hypothetical protein
MKRIRLVGLTVLAVFTVNCSAQIQNQLNQIGQFESIKSEVCSEASVFVHDLVIAKAQGRSQMQGRQSIDKSELPTAQKVRLTGILSVIYARPSTHIDAMDLAISYYMHCANK